jgi:uncharacterized repeat protein (TIGR02543 family)
MKAIFNLRKHSYLKTIGTLLIAVALIAGVVGCEGEGEVEYDLAVDSTAGGVVTDPGEGTFTHDEGEVVDLVAIPDCGYVFDNWTGDTTDIGDVNAAATNITMNADYSITANFKPIPPDHFKFYQVFSVEPVPIGTEVLLEDQFGTFETTVMEAMLFGNPVEKEHATGGAPIYDPNRHYTMYELLIEEEQAYKVMINNQFQDDVELTVYGPVALAVPTQKEGHEMVECLNHYLLYYVDEADYYEFDPVEGVNLKDQFIPDGEDVRIEGPYLFANPVKKTVVGSSEVTEIQNPDEHWVLYDIYDMESPSIEKNGLQIDNQFGPQTLDLTYRDTLAVPSQKIEWEQPLNHFKTYWAGWPIEPPPEWEPPLPVDVQLEDQFVTINATVGDPYLFANPTFKGITEEDWTPIWDPNDHLTVYDIDYTGEPQVWEVTVNNQFGNGQVLYIAGPFYLAVPTGKLAPDWPADLNHFLVYEVVDHGVYPPKEVYIEDQFFSGGAWTDVYGPEYFAVPAQKIHPPGSAPTPIVDDVHLVFYWLDGIEPLNMYNLPIINQFGEQYLDVAEGEGNFLGVPSVKTNVDGPWPYD